MKFNHLIPFALLFISPLVSASPIEDRSISRSSALEPSGLIIKRDNSDLLNKLRAKGKDIWDKLEARRQEKCPVDVSKDQAKFDKYWREAMDVNAPAALRPQFAADKRNINNGDALPDGAFLQAEYRSKTNGQADKTAYDNLFAPQLKGSTSGNGGVIIAANNKAAEDKSDPSDKLRFSEILFWEYKGAADSTKRSAKVSNLQWVFRSNIINEDTNNLIKEVQKRRGNPDNEQQWTLGDDADAFLALVGSDNVKSIAWMLNDHVNAFIRKSIVSIWTQPDGKSLAIEIGINKK